MIDLAPISMSLLHDDYTRLKKCVLMSILTSDVNIRCYTCMQNVESSNIQECALQHYFQWKDLEATWDHILAERRDRENVLDIHHGAICNT